MTKEERLQKQREWYKKNPGKYYEYGKKKRKAIAEWLQTVKESVPCMDCKLMYPYYVMDFDHRPDETKLFQPHRLSKMQSWKRAKEEISKCDVVCANCHRFRTAMRLRENGSD